MIKRPNSQYNINERFSKKPKIHKNIKYMNVNINHEIFDKCSIEELKDLLAEINNIIHNLELYKERIQNVLSIYV